ncbi:MAG: HAD-IIIA family hydrolase [Bacteroidota bacterium]
MKLDSIKLLILDVDGTLTDGGIYISDDGSQQKRFSAKDGLGIKMAIEQGITVGIISHSHSTLAIETRVRALGIQKCYIGNRDKLQVLQDWLPELKVQKENVAFIGDDLNDKNIMLEVAVSACPADAHHEIKEIAGHVLTKKGGEGCVREFIDQYLIN